MQVLYEDDEKLVCCVIVDDYKVNVMEVLIDEVCMCIIVKCQLIVKDLCFIMVIIKIIIDLEWIGDFVIKMVYIVIECLLVKQY